PWCPAWSGLSPRVQPFPINRLERHLRVGGNGRSGAGSTQLVDDVAAGDDDVDPLSGEPLAGVEDRLGRQRVEARLQPDLAELLREQVARAGEPVVDRHLQRVLL